MYMVYRNSNTQRSFIFGLFMIFTLSYVFPTSWLHVRTLPEPPPKLNLHGNGILFDLKHAPPIPVHSLTVVLPLTSQSLPFLPDIILPLLKPSAYIFEIVLVCPPSIAAKARITLRKIEQSNSDHPDILLQILVGGLDQDSGVINAASLVSTEWVLLMNQHGLSQANNHSQTFLLRPKVIPVPIGPRGFSVSKGNISCLPPSEMPQRASYLYPPFVMPTSLAIKLQSASEDPWAALGHHISESRSDGLGGIAVGVTILDPAWCSALRRSSITPLHSFRWDSQLPNADSTDSAFLGQSDMLSPPSTSGMLVIFLPTLHDFQDFSSLACILQKHNRDFKVFIYDELRSSNHEQLGWDDRLVVLNECRLTYSVDLSRSSFSAYPSGRIASDWLEALGRQPDIILGLSEEDHFFGLLAIMYPNDFFRFIRLPRSDLPYCGWMGSLSLAEWQNWNTFRIDISIITKDRPYSFARLLSSLSKGIFFGDMVDLRINLEQSSDGATMKIAESWNWTHGSFFLHHRVIQGGLLPAIVESWYPRSNDTYGLLLEDDVELSPLFYAWAKMSLLRYRYGDPSNRSPSLFGISFYQQKNVELPAEGRRPFNARNLFSESGISDPSTPYLSPVPCSWGAVYFPEHWREFHAYLSVRLSEYSMKIDEIVVPNVRSNNWAKSWKKYFIELVYLRGYVMLYPNYRDFVSLSTNHIEVGSHVKFRTKEKQDSFILPLMQLPSPGASVAPGLLDLPGSTLPMWDSLPVLNLTGSLATLQSLSEIGRLRRTKLTGCINDPAWYDIPDLMCISEYSRS